MSERSWFRVPRRQSWHAQRANDVTVPLVDRIGKAARTPKTTSKVRTVKKGQWIEHAKKRRAK